MDSLASDFELDSLGLDIEETNEGKPYIRYWSKHDNPMNQYLSNFQMLPKYLSYRAVKFPSIEHAFQAEKYRMFCGTLESWAPLKSAREVPDGKAALKFGRKRIDGYDQNKWDLSRGDVMIGLVMARMEVDETYRKMLQYILTHDVLLLHISKYADENDFWACKIDDRNGAIIGFNMTSHYIKMAATRYFAPHK
jgi:predicted NAD-dependent protein-ADP-ribosyltransferase YbiA (DUF1768 family)